ncbi:MAG: hypothetical protein WBP29_01850 [Candidatus Zixiibacteriota bacterium]
MRERIKPWTPIWNAVDAFNRRLASDRDAVYEHLWRLLHINEALVVTMGSLLAGIINEFELEGDDRELMKKLNVYRAVITGVQNPDRDEPPVSSCLSTGSIQTWTELLGRFTKDNLFDCHPFASALKEYLLKPVAVEVPYLVTWKEIGPVPELLSKPENRLASFAAMNHLRNRIAHVPLPHPILRSLFAGVRNAIGTAVFERASEVASDDAELIHDENWHNILQGFIFHKGVLLTGALTPVHWKDTSANRYTTAFLWLNSQSDDKPVVWQAEPFVYVNDECKPMLLFRVPGLGKNPEDDNKGEYHRFAAEARPVLEVQIDSSMFAKLIPKPISAETETRRPEDQPIRSGDELESNDQQLRNAAEEAFRSRNWELSSGLFTQLRTRESHLYTDVARSKHGAALWRTAESALDLSAEDRAEKIREAIKILEEASLHVDIYYKSLALYQMSKAYFHLFKYSKDSKDFGEAKNKALEAATVSLEVEYLSWYEYLEEFEPTIQRN